MSVIRGEILIQRPIEEVFDFVADQRNEPRYNRTMLRSQLLSPEPVGEGARFEAEARGRGVAVRITHEVTAFDRPVHLASKSRFAAVEVAGDLWFTEERGATRMRWAWRLRPRGALWLLSPLLATVGRRQERRVWRAMRRLLELGPNGAVQ